MSTHPDHLGQGKAYYHQSRDARLSQLDCHIQVLVDFR
jgi:hypothetical protein